MNIAPIDLLTLELLKYTKAKQKSLEAYEKDLIPYVVHKDHLENLEPIIQEYKDAIQTLTIYGR